MGATQPCCTRRSACLSESGLWMTSCVTTKRDIVRERHGPIEATETLFASRSETLRQASPCKTIPPRAKVPPNQRCLNPALDAKILRGGHGELTPRQFQPPGGQSLLARPSQCPSHCGLPSREQSLPWRVLPTATDTMAEPRFPVAAVVDVPRCCQLVFGLVAAAATRTAAAEVPCEKRHY